ncbi:MAG TPA: SpoIID/LytB domain-containing protein [Syntrophorhabdaceae bacterium]|nr:SpoIID/LytB domain-containing protein [Syntrophorhabdaceae bacterium]
MDGVPEVTGSLNGAYNAGQTGIFSGRFHAAILSGAITLFDVNGRELIRGQEISLMAAPESSFTLSGVTIGKSFHWERKENQTFKGDLILKRRGSDRIVIINNVHLEDYLESVISSEMSSDSPAEFLAAHAILSRSWLLAALKRKQLCSENSSVIPPHDFENLASHISPL